MPRAPAAPGIAVYFLRRGLPYCLPCDTYSKVADTIAAVAAHFEATRAIERHGVATLGDILAGFAALPAPSGPPGVILLPPPTEGGAMTPEAAGVRFRVDPRDVPPVKAARLLGLTLSAFETALPRLHARGFPVPDPDTGNFDMNAIEAWKDRRSGLAKAGEPLNVGPGEFAARLGQLRETRRR